MSTNPSSTRQKKGRVISLPPFWTCLAYYRIALPSPRWGEWSALCPGLFTSGVRPRYPFNRTLVESQSLSGCFGEEKFPTATWTQTPDQPAHSLVTVLTTLSWLNLQNFFEKTSSMFANLWRLTISKFFIHQLTHKWTALKTILKFTLKQLWCVSVQSHHHQGQHYLCLLKLQLLR
jgi:hypothetical protein